MESEWRPVSRSHRVHVEPFQSLPDGAFVQLDGIPHVVAARELLRWTPAGYTGRERRPARGSANVITPPSLVEVLRAGWDPLVPLLHPSANVR